MRVSKELGMLVMSAVILLSSYASAVPVGGTLIGTHTENFSIGASVQCSVYQYTPSQFVYAYQISNSGSMGISFFSVAADNGMANVWAASVESNPFLGWIDPAFWGIVNSPLQSVNAVFTDSIDAQETSSILWFVSDHAPGNANGTLFGTTGGTPTYSIGTLLAPVPEPITLALLGLGAAIVLRKRQT